MKEQITLKLKGFRELFSQGKISRKELIGIFIILLMAIVPPVMGHTGWDFRVSIRGDTLSGAYGTNAFHPYPAFWLFYPFAVLPLQWGMFMWNLVGAICFLYAIKKLGGSFLGFALSLPAFWTFYAGQIEGFIALGLALALTSPPLVAGIGILLLTLKPQIGLFAILFVLLTRKNWKLLVAPFVVYALSLLVWGWWIPDWLESLSRFRIEHFNLIVGFFPWTLPLLVFLTMVDIRVWLIVQALVMPYHTFYSLAPLFTLPINLIWIDLLGWGLFLGVNWLPGFIPRPGAILGAILFVIIVMTVRKERKAKKLSAV